MALRTRPLGGSEPGMTQNIIFPENLAGDELLSFQRLMALVPPEAQSDIKLKRFLVFRMKIDGEETTRNYLLDGLQEVREKAFPGSLYEYLSDGSTGGDNITDPPPDEMG